MKFSYQEIVLMNDSTVKSAAIQFIDRKNRTEHPEGEFDNAQRWYPDDSEKLNTAYFRTPSRAYPYSYMTACRTAEHVAALHGIYEPYIREYIEKNNLSEDEAKDFEERNKANLLAVKRVAKLIEKSEDIDTFIIDNLDLKFTKNENGKHTLCLNNEEIDTSIFDDEYIKYIPLTKVEVKKQYDFNLKDVKANEICLVRIASEYFCKFILSFLTL